MLLLLPLSRLLGLDPSMAGFGPGMLLEEPGNLRLGSPGTGV